MPIYEYQCANCGQKIDVIQKISDEPLQRCEACGQNSLNKLISATHFQLKGGGWYKAPPVEKSSGTDKESTSKSETSETSETNAQPSSTEQSVPTSNSQDKDK